MEKNLIKGLFTHYGQVKGNQHVMLARFARNTGLLGTALNTPRCLKRERERSSDYLSQQELSVCERAA